MPLVRYPDFIRSDFNNLRNPRSLPCPDQNPRHQDKLDKRNQQNRPVSLEGQQAGETQADYGKREKQIYQSVSSKGKITPGQDTRLRAVRILPRNDHGLPVFRP